MRTASKPLSTGFLSNVALIFLATFVTLLCPPAAFAQDDAKPDRGFHPANSYSLGDIETIDTSSGNLMLNIPLAALPAGRGGHPGFKLTLSYNSKIYDTHVEIVPDEYGRDEEQNHLGDSVQGGWHYNLFYDLEVHNRLDHWPDPSNRPQPNELKYIYRYKVKLHMPDGSTREVRPLNSTDYLGDGYFQGSPQPGMTYYTTDGSYVRLDIGQNNEKTLSFPDGSRVVFGNGPQRHYDRNGNYVTIQGFTYNTHPATQIVDQLNRSIIIEYDQRFDPVTGMMTRQDNVYADGFNGNKLLNWTIHWKEVYVNKSYFATRTRSQQYFMGPFSVIDRITLPTQAGDLSYTFGYNAPDSDSGQVSYGWGEVSSVTLPSGAQASYTYALDGVSAPYQSGWPSYEHVLNNKPTRKDLTYQAEYDGASAPVTETWLYGGGYASTIVPQISNITAPDGGVTTESFYTAGSTLFGGRSFKTKHSDGTVVERLWAENRPYFPTGAGPATNVAVNAFVKTEFTSITDAAGALTKTAIKDYSYDKNGNVTQVKEYDWVAYGSVPRDASGKPTGIPAGAPLLRVTTNTYNGPTPDASNTTTDDPDTYHKATASLLRNAVASSEVGNGTQTLSRAEFFYDDATTTGNLVQQKSWDSTNGAITRPLSTNSVSVSHTYDAYGNRTLSTDANAVQTQYVYGAVGGYTALYQTQVKAAYLTAVQRTTNLAYDFKTGLVTRSTDVDNNVATATSYDVLGRPTLVQAADGKPEETQTSMTYSDVGRYVITRSDKDALGDGKLVNVRHYDQLGRVRLARSLEDTTTQSETDEADGIKVQTRYRYSGSNSYRLVSNPYKAATSGAASTETTMGWTRSKADIGGRVIEVRTYSGSSLPAPWGANASNMGILTTAYDASYTTVTDQAGKLRRSMTDGLGRLSRVDEPDSSNNLGLVTAPTQPTSYTYDVLGNLKTVTQTGQQNGQTVTQTRTFTYDSLSRLQTAVNPESGTINYDYDDNGNLTKKIDPRFVPGSTTIKLETVFAYDALNRPVSSSYNDSTPDAAYYYDAQVLPTGAPTFARGFAKGRLVAVTSGGTSAGNYYGYDALGRALRRIQQTDSTNYLSEATYNKAGAMATETYPVVPGKTGRRTVTYGFDGAGRLSSVSAAATTYANYTASVTGISYAPHGGLLSGTLGNNLNHARVYNARLQPTQIKLGTSAAPTSVLSLTNNYGTTQNNGNVLDVTHKIGTWTTKQTYTYDSLNRLDSTAETNAAGTTTYWTEDNGYDRFGNRWQVVSGIASLTFNSQNRVVGYTYDAAGNVTNDTTGHTYAYDAENRIKTVDGVANTYVYDGEGKRVKKYFPLGEQVRFVYGVTGQLLMEFDTTNNGLRKEYIYGGDGLLATIDQVNGTRYTTADHLGSPRVVTGSTGAVVSRHDYRPFGQELTVGDGGRTAAQFFDVDDDVRQKFTQHERDAETGLDYMKARYYSSTQGRFASPDRPFADQRQSNPQTWNLYSYVQNNPTNFTDPSGRCSAPSGLKPGQVGLCIEAFIASPRVGKKIPHVFGRGDNRVHSGTYPDYKAKFTSQLIVTKPENGTANISGHYEIADSVVDIPLPELWEGYPTVISVTTPGAGESAITNPITNDETGTTTFTLTASTINGFQAQGIPGAPGGAVELKFNIIVTKDGKVGLGEGSSVKDFPSYAIYAYRFDHDGKLETVEIRTTNETTVDDLEKPMRPIAPVEPR